MICLFGGTFDPIHNGHIQGALAGARWLSAESVRLLLSARPSHRRLPEANVQQRWHMLELACAQHDVLVPDDLELRRDSSSYTIHTLQALQGKHPRESLAWLIGSDTYLGLPTWYRWREVLELCHIVVLQRAGYEHLNPSIGGELARETQARRVDQFSVATGQMLFVPGALPEVSATDIRERLHNGQSVDHLLPAAVTAYISEQQLYGGVLDSPSA